LRCLSAAFKGHLPYLAIYEIFFGLYYFIVINPIDNIVKFIDIIAQQMYRVGGIRARAERLSEKDE
jgi:hypothetical protein